ncbi:MAG: NAD(P)H-dependent oxidoreductase [Chitinophagaceae bacterium]|nr:NAD(P)H-dependent oxidoreductase [Chitinophagaceae bacterium]
MKNILIIYAHPDENSFNAAVLQQTIIQFETEGIPYNIIDLYKENYNPVLSKAEMKGELSAGTLCHQQLIKNSTDIIFIFPVWWFRAPAILEGFIDKTFVPKFAYRFKPIIGKYGLPIPLLKDKKVLAFITHGAPALPVKTLYVNVVKYRFLLGFLSFCFNIFTCKIVQLWSVPFIDDAKRKSYLNEVSRVINAKFAPATVVKKAAANLAKA